jgi:hypothetical protein
VRSLLEALPCNYCLTAGINWMLKESPLKFCPVISEVSASRYAF